VFTHAVSVLNIGGFGEFSEIRWLFVDMALPSGHCLSLWVKIALSIMLTNYCKVVGR